MPDHPPREGTDQLLELLRSAERTLAGEPNDLSAAEIAQIRSSLDRIEASTPGGAPLHGQLDNVRKWLDALEQPADHERFGGVAHLRAYVLTQLRLALGALEDYDREMN